MYIIYILFIYYIYYIYIKSNIDAKKIPDKSSISKAVDPLQDNEP